MNDEHTEEHRCNCPYCHAWGALGFSAKSGPMVYAGVGASVVFAVGVFAWLMQL